MKLNRRWSIRVAVAGAALLGISASAAVAQVQEPAAATTMLAVPQLAQPGATEHRRDHSVAGPSTATTTLCEPGAAWVRPHFAALTLKGADTVTLHGQKGESSILTADHGQDRSLSTRSFGGDCVQVTANLADPTSRFTIDSIQSGTALADVVVAGAGDLCGPSCPSTADVVGRINPAAVFTAGDNAYDSGTLSEYRNKYDPAWGRFKSITHPSPGNHEYQTSGAAGYFDYFNGSGNANGPAGPRGKGFYSWDIGDWHFVALNSNISTSAGSEQEQFLRNDLRATTKPCTAAYWHHPLFTRGEHSNSTSVRPLWQALYDNKADLILVGHDHNYQRYAPQTPTGGADPTNGVRQILIGTGGQSLYDFTRTMPNVESSNDGTHGVLKLSLSATGYRGDFVPVEGRTFTDTFTGTCHPKGTQPPGTEVFADDFETNKGWTTNAAGTDNATTGRWERGDPEQTAENGVKQLGTTTSGVNCLVTARLAGSGPGANDVDAGRTSTLSPAITLPAGTLTASFRWNLAHGSNSSTSDYLKVTIQGSTNKILLDQRGAAADVDGSWRTASVNVSEFAGQTVRILVEAADDSGASLVEAAIDDLKITKQ